MVSYKEDFDRYDVSLSNEEACEFILELIKDYQEVDIAERTYDESYNIPENIIYLYINYIVKNNIELLYDDFKEAFVTNEAIVEPGVSEDEKAGLGAIYDYIKNFSINGSFNIFVALLQMHTLLYSKCPHPEYGGKFRTETAVLKDVEYEVPSPTELLPEINKYISIKLEVEEGNIFRYINDAIKISTDLIALQPFPDGNKRTARALLNLALKRIGIPPLYIHKNERDTYKKALLQAIIEKDYSFITRFYYFKICDAIVSLDIKKAFDSVTNENISEINKRKKI